MNLTIGSGDISVLLSGIHTKGFQDLLRKFVSDEKPVYNSLASPIDALRTGAILETNYLNILPNNYFPQWKETCKEMDCFTSSIDFAKIEGGKIVDFDELKTIYLTDFLEIIQPLKQSDEKQSVEVLKKKFKSNYNQLQGQLLCSELSSANLVFLSVEDYDDQVNELREIRENEYVRFRVQRDEKVIGEIRERLKFFQSIKNYFPKQ